MRRKITAHVATAFGLYILDAFVFGQGVLASLVAIVMVIVGTVQVGRSIGGDRTRVRHGGSIIATYVALVVAVFMTISWNNQLARERADTIIAALSLYKAQHGDYPTKLSELVPEQLPAVPRAKYTVLFSDFAYFYDPIEHRGFLLYTSLPPFGRPTFSLERQRWGYVD